MMAAYTRKSLQQLDQADVYAPRIRHSHASGGVVSLLIRCVAPLFCHSQSRIFVIVVIPGFISDVPIL